MAIRVGIVGGNYGRTVLLPAFRLDPRCDVVALAGSDAARAEKVAREAGVSRSYGSWRLLAEADDIDVLAIATPPSLQPQIAVRALALGKPVFVEKPLAADLAGARAMLSEAQASDRPAAVDFEFTQLPAWRQAKAMLDSGAVGGLRHVVVTWQVETYATRMRLDNWKTSREQGGGALANLASHGLHYLEWFCGPITALSARASGLPGESTPSESMVALAMSFASGACGSLSVSTASYLGSGHRLEFYGEDGALVLANPTTRYMRGFTLHYARRPAAALATVSVASDPRDIGDLDDRIAPVSRLAATFLDAIEQGKAVSPGLQEGYRVQWLIEAARRAHDRGVWLAADERTMRAEKAA